MQKEALKTLEENFGRSQAGLIAQLDKLNIY